MVDEVLLDDMETDNTFPTDTKPCPLLWNACKKGFYDEVYTLLFKYRVDPEERGGRYHTTPLMVAARHYRVNIVKLLLEVSADTSARDDRGMTAFHLAYSEGHLPIMALLLEDGVDPDERPGTANPSCKPNNRHLLV
jgi:ankyrin repeat protein